LLINLQQFQLWTARQTVQKVREHYQNSCVLFVHVQSDRHIWAVLKTDCWFKFRFSYWATVCKAVCPMLSIVVCPACLSVCLSVCDIGVLWPSGWMDRDETCVEVRLGPDTLC